MSFFFAFWIILIVGLLIHVLVDRHPNRRSAPRLVELALLWLLVYGGMFGLVGVLGHIGPDSGSTAESIGYAQSMFQWEVGWADLALSVLGIMCFRYRDRWLTAAVVAIAIAYGGDAIGHIMEMSNGNDAVNNVWAMPSDILQGLIGIVLLVMYRRGLGALSPLRNHGVVGTSAYPPRLHA